MHSSRRAFLVVGFHNRPGRIGGVGIEKHRLLRFGIVVPFVQAGQIDRAELPLFQRIILCAR